jgi:hypothetical protein
MEQSIERGCGQSAAAGLQPRIALVFGGTLVEQYEPSVPRFRLLQFGEILN